MCDYSLHAVASRPAKVGETLITTTRGAATRGFTSAAVPEVAVCLLPGTELAFENDVRYEHKWIWTKRGGFKVARFRKIEQNVWHQHHDAIEFPDGSSVFTALERPASDRPAIACGISGVGSVAPSCEVSWKSK